MILVNFDKQYLMNVTFDSDEICSAYTMSHALSTGEETAKSYFILLSKTGPKYTRKRCSTHFRRELRRDNNREPSDNYRNDRIPASKESPVSRLLIMTRGVTLMTTRKLNLEKLVFSEFLENWLDNPQPNFQHRRRTRLCVDWQNFKKIWFPVSEKIEGGHIDPPTP